MINRETIIDFFEDLKEGNDFNTNEKLLWTYFFLDKNKRKLDDFTLKLEKLGYKFDSIFEAKKINDTDDTEYYLQVTNIQHHTIDSLHALNIMFYNLAEVNHIDYYDGFDVGNIT
ncbi:ribonuclease E inhibitor RraB [Flavobacterium sp. Fl-318]|uniref:Ribonuclease E inhibitor RraB n=1 Tax=Flavobacterium cupriresistens TaxID=2893885 RepID=A0ABU4R586_9FLAO|nr:MULTISPECIES: ribonuclease E inhibitor RraB [unclassified Flavobacterium]MDX6187744.1 ribonuclease E inhibitor RraB [Flavobacterium sp. Fl-318]UFH42333.1 ribonuclease E inhibitor RraB [Flavobacterium sp. F-323]